MIDFERFIFEFLSVNRFSTSTVASCEVSALDHKPEKLGVSRRVNFIELLVFTP